MLKKRTPRSYKLSIFSLTMITVVSVDSLRNLPATALFGSHLIFFFSLATLLFLLPTALISAELASIFPDESGIYIWVKTAFNYKLGVIAIWLQWIENVIWYPTILAFVAGSLAYLIDPALAQSKLFLTITILVCFWLTTLINYFGIQSSAWFSNFCSIAGMILPMLFIIGLGIIWLINGHPSQVAFTKQTMLPHHEHWSSLTAVILSFCGMEIATVHAHNTRTPQRSFPIALAYATAIIVSTLLLGGLTIAVVLPAHQINLVAGIMQTFDLFFRAYHLQYLLPITALSLVIGGMGGVSNWTIAPLAGLAIASKEGRLPQWIHKENRYGAPAKALIVQAILVSLLSTIFLIFPTINESYWLLTALAVQLYMLMYILMFVAAIKLRRQQRSKTRPVFRIPGGLSMLYLVVGLGMIGSIITLIVSFIPPIELAPHEWRIYLTSLSVGLVGLTCIPLLAIRRTKT